MIAGNSIARPSASVKLDGSFAAGLAAGFENDERPRDDSRER
jgi:hypothetical protein